jgi:hypothetical protein
MISFSKTKSFRSTSATIAFRLFTSSINSSFAQKFPYFKPFERNILIMRAVFSMLLLSSSDSMLKYCSNFPILLLKL